MNKLQEIRANFDRNTITVYQAFSKSIALPAIKNNRFEAPFSFNRMTWIKPSFLWLMERSNYATKANQEYILATKIKRQAWEKTLSLGVLTNPDKTVYKNGSLWQQRFNEAKVHIQWGLERSIKGSKLEMRSIQVCISRHLIKEYNEEWIKEIRDYTPLAKKINTFRKQGKYKEVKRLLPAEKIYRLSDKIGKTIGLK